MKQIFIFALLITLLSTQSIQAQVNLEISTGLNYSNNKFLELKNMFPAYRSDFFIGIAPILSLNNHFDVLINAQYSRKGFTQSDECINCIAANSNSSVRYTYIEFNPEIEYKILQYIALGLGASYGIKLNEAHKQPDSEWRSTGKNKFIKSSDFGITGKIKAKFKKIQLLCSI